jgi:hypothetical protein
MQHVRMSRFPFVLRKRAVATGRIRLRPANSITLALAVALAACSRSQPRTYEPLRYDYLTPIRLNVQTVDYDPHVFPLGSNDVSGLDPAPPVQTLMSMARDRLQAVGSTSRAVFVVKSATFTRTGSGIDGTMDVELDVYGDGGTRAGYAQARVSRRQTGDIDDIRATLYDMTKAMMDSMNIEFEYQVRHNLKDWLAPANATPAPVQQQNLAPPPSAAGAPSAVPSLAPPTPTLSAPALPAPALSAPAPAPPITAPAAPSLGPAPTQLLPPQTP